MYKNKIIEAARKAVAANPLMFSREMRELEAAIEAYDAWCAQLKSETAQIIGGG